MLQDFFDIEKERKLQYRWYHNFRSYMVELMGVEPMSEKGSKRVSPGAGSRFDFPYSSDECQTELFGSFMGS